ncbi:MAG TPA: hypothetical protein DCZ03_01135 [Gammaproteobacteria bacterium]|nr:hypothetical protein [Gammaproteobacteria bacterium]
MPFLDRLVKYFFLRSANTLKISIFDVSFTLMEKLIRWRSNELADDDSFTSVIRSFSYIDTSHANLTPGY